MKTLVTGSSGHLGEALARTLRARGNEVVGLDLNPGAETDYCGSISDRAFVGKHMSGVQAVFHTATLHKPHIATHSRQDFVNTNITGTLNLLEEAMAARVGAFIFTSTTSVFGRALQGNDKAGAVWVTEELAPIPKNIYGVTKLAAENLCELFHRKFRMPFIILRTSRFFPEEDDRAEVRNAFSGGNVQVNELLYRRADLCDVVGAHICALNKARERGFGRFIISATTPFDRGDLAQLKNDAPGAAAKYFDYETVYDRIGWRMFDAIDRVYDNSKARNELGWRPQYDFARALRSLEAGKNFQSPLALSIGAKGYHAAKFTDGPYPVEGD